MNNVRATPPWMLIVGTAAMALATGCQLVVDPFTDELAAQKPPTTPSVEAARAAPAQPTPLPRSYAEIPVRAKDGTVTHGALLFEDAAGMAEEEDDRFAWSDEDYLRWMTGTARFLINIVLYPVNAVVTPPWRVMASDGRPSRRVPAAGTHDAQRWIEPSTGKPGG